MHLLESYALVSGAQIDKCFIEEEKINLPNKKYITFHGYNPKGSGRQYKHWNSVLSELINQNFPYNIIQIGSKNDISYPIIDTSYLGKTSYNSLAYLIKHSELHLGFDSLPVHLASHYDKKMVVIYAHYANNTRPYFSSSSNIILIQPDFSNIKPVFDINDPFELINTISVDHIVSSINKLLGLRLE